MDSSTINSRVGALIKTLKMSNNAFAKSIGKTSSTINFIVDGRSKPGFEVLEAICEVYMAVNPIWLLRGEGEMFHKQSDEQAAELAPDKYLQDHIKQLESSFTNLAQQLAVKDRQIDGLQRTVDALLLGKPKDVAQVKTARIKPMYPVQETLSLHPEKEALIA
jgi:DNA-binding Xre family transcriptional regulator